MTKCNVHVIIRNVFFHNRLTTTSLSPQPFILLAHTWSRLYISLVSLHWAAVSGRCCAVICLKPPRWVGRHQLVSLSGGCCRRLVTPDRSTVICGGESQSVATAISHPCRAAQSQSPQSGRLASWSAAPASVMENRTDRRRCNTVNVLPVPTDPILVLQPKLSRRFLPLLAGQ